MTRAERARDLRRRETGAEQVLWHLLRGRQLGAKFRRQHPFAGYVVDFYCPEHRLAVEVDGAQHSTDEAMAYDEYRAEAMTAAGIRTLRFTNAEVLQHRENMLSSIRRALGTDELPSDSS